MMEDFFRIEFDRIGFKFEDNPIGALVRIEWQGQVIVGRVWSASYCPKKGYYGIGIRLEPGTLKEGQKETKALGV